MIRTVGVIGAGFAGLSTAKVLREFGFDVTVIDKEPEVGGVWAASRRYPGLTTQNVRSTYSLSDFPYPADYPEWPTGEQVQRYLESYVDHTGLREHLALGCLVRSAQRDPDTGRWLLDVAGLGTREFDFLVVCNGIYSDPFVPEFDGAAEFVAAGGRICHTVDFHDPEEARDKHVLVVGYGKSSCDVANATVGVSASTVMAVRRVIWKIPRKFRNKLNFKWLMLTRMGENLFPYFERRGMEKFMHGAGKPVRNSMVNSVESVVRKQFDLEALGLLPDGSLETIINGTVSLETPGFFENVAAGRLKVVRDTVIERLEPGVAVLGDGSRVLADVIVCGTGFHQRVPFLDEDVQAAVTDDDGNFRLYRHILPIGVDNLAFNGYNSSFFSQLNSEMSALWLAAHLTGLLRLPSAEAQSKVISERLDWTAVRTQGGNGCHGTNIVPFSMHNVDELLRDLDLTRSALARAKEWLVPVDPGTYAGASRDLLARHGRALAEQERQTVAPIA